MFFHLCTTGAEAAAAVTGDDPGTAEGHHATAAAAAIPAAGAGRPSTPRSGRPGPSRSRTCRSRTATCGRWYLIDRVTDSLICLFVICLLIHRLTD